MTARILALTPEPEAYRPLEGAGGGDVLRTESDVAEGLRRFSEGGWSLVLLDSAFAGGSGVDLLGRMCAEEEATRIALVARHPSVEITLRALEAGATDVLAFPPELCRVARMARSGRGEASRGAIPLSEAGEEGDLVGRSPSMVEVFRSVARVASSSATVLVQGESGTGKELVAEALHRNSPRRTGPFVAINCAAIPQALLESELFGHEKGAFTGAISRRRGRIERADGGTLFLDEVGDMPLPLQAKILRTLQEREVERVGGHEPLEVDVRIVAATNRDLEAEVREGRFREDLFYRLSVVPLHLPPLRERGDDLLLLALHFGAHARRRHERRVHSLSLDAADRMAHHSWPGNVRELRNVMERAVLLADGPVILPDHLPSEIRDGREPDPATPLPPTATLEEVEVEHIRRVLRAEEGNLTRASEVLGIHRNTLRRKIRRHEITR